MRLAERVLGVRSGDSLTRLLEELNGYFADLSRVMPADQKAAVEGGDCTDGHEPRHGQRGQACRRHRGLTFRVPWPVLLGCVGAPVPGESGAD